jgi:CubicO group peptidase (beta-lactamase class C family)
MADAHLDPAKLQAAFDYALSQNSLGLLVLKGGRITAEQYASSWGPEKLNSLASATKSMTALMVGMALEEGKLKSLDEPMTDFAPWWKGTEKEGITLRHMLSMSSGLDPKNVDLNAPGDQFENNSRMPLKAEPGVLWGYNTAAYHMLFRVLEKATGDDLESYAARKLFTPIGLEHYAWQKQKSGAVTNYYRLDSCTRDMARFGLLALRGGEWKGRRLVSEQFVRLATSPSQSMNPSYGLLWWVNAKPGRAAGAAGGQASLRFPGAPADTFAALGAGSQNIVVIPSLDLVIVRQGGQPKDRDFAAKFVRLVLEAARP